MIALCEFSGAIGTVIIVKVSKVMGTTISSSLADKGAAGAERVYGL